MHVVGAMHQPLQPLSAKYFVHQYSPLRRLALVGMVRLDRVLGSSRKMLVLASKGRDKGPAPRSEAGGRA